MTARRYRNSLANDPRWAHYARGEPKARRRNRRLSLRTAAHDGRPLLGRGRDENSSPTGLARPRRPVGCGPNPASPDLALSRRKQGFESPRERQLIFPPLRFQWFRLVFV